ncbi:MAG: hypothetical protein ACPL7K_07435, partial [Armatimonadota bacterium]
MKTLLTGIALSFVLARACMADFSPGSPQPERFRFDSLDRGQIEIALCAAHGESHRIPAIVTDRAVFDMFRLRLGRFISPRLELAGEVALARQSGHTDNHGWSAIGSIRRYISVRGSTAIAWDFSIGVTGFDRRLTSQATRVNFT